MVAVVMQNKRSVSKGSQRTFGLSTGVHVVISFEDAQNTQTEHHIDSAWSIRMYYEDTITMKTCFQMQLTLC
jgi:hypothetical protein